jgi:hypothetical protein
MSARTLTCAPGSTAAALRSMSTSLCRAAASPSCSGPRAAARPPAAGAGGSGSPLRGARGGGRAGLAGRRAAVVCAAAPPSSGLRDPGSRPVPAPQRGGQPAFRLRPRTPPASVAIDWRQGLDLLGIGHLLQRRPRDAVGRRTPARGHRTRAGHQPAPAADGRAAGRAGRAAQGRGAALPGPSPCTRPQPGACPIVYVSHALSTKWHGDGAGRPPGAIASGRALTAAPSCCPRPAPHRCPTALGCRASGWASRPAWRSTPRSRAWPWCAEDPARPRAQREFTCSRSEKTAARRLSCSSQWRPDRRGQ